MGAMGMVVISSRRGGRWKEAKGVLGEPNKAQPPPVGPRSGVPRIRPSSPSTSCSSLPTRSPALAFAQPAPLQPPPVVSLVAHTPARARSPALRLPTARLFDHTMSDDPSGSGGWRFAQCFGDKGEVEDITEGPPRRPRPPRARADLRPCARVPRSRQPTSSPPSSSTRPATTSPPATRAAASSSLSATSRCVAPGTPPRGPRPGRAGTRG
jgi:hypothetical protein